MKQSDRGASEKKTNNFVFAQIGRFANFFSSHTAKRSKKKKKIGNNGQQ